MSPRKQQKRSSHSKQQKLAELRSIAQGILGYLAQRPEAKDTLEGIAHWWIQRQCSDRLVDNVEQALAFLVEHNLLLEKRSQGTASYYQLNSQKRQAIAQ